MNSANPSLHIIGPVELAVTGYQHGTHSECVRDDQHFMGLDPPAPLCLVQSLHGIHPANPLHWLKSAHILGAQHMLDLVEDLPHEFL